MSTVRKNPDTSIDAYKSLKASDVRKTYEDILSALDTLGKGTFEDIAAYLKCKGDKIWKRLSEMERMEMIYKPGTKKTLKSGRKGYEWSRTHPSKTEEQQKELTRQDVDNWFQKYQSEKPEAKLIQMPFNF
jgi:predicted transcriptional regulator